MGLFSKSNWKFWIGLIIGLFFLTIAFQGQDFGAIAQSLTNANYIWLIPALIFYFAGVGVRTVRWQYLLRPIKTVQFNRLFPVIVIGYMANNVLPVRMGEVVRAYVLNRREETVRKTSALATIVVERIMDGITMILFLSVASLFVKLNSQIEGIARAGSLVFLIGIAIFFAVAHSRSLLKGLENFGLKFVPAKLQPKVAGLADSFIDGLQVLRNWQDLIAVFVLSIVAWSCEAAMFWLISLAFPNFILSAAAVFMTLAVANLVTLVPSTPGYVGPFDAAAKLVLVGLFAQPQDVALSYIILLHATLYLPVTLLGLYYWLQDQFSFKEISREPEPTLTTIEEPKKTGSLVG